MRQRPENDSGHAVHQQGFSVHGECGRGHRHGFRTYDGPHHGETDFSSGFPIQGGNGNINGPLGIATDASGKFVYVCSASNDVSVLSITNAGALTAVPGSPFPAGGNAPTAILFVKKAN